MLTIKERLAELDQKISDELSAGNGHPRAECDLQYKIRYMSPAGCALRSAQSHRGELGSKALEARYELAKAQRALDDLNKEIEAAELTVFTLENLPSPF